MSVFSSASLHFSKQADATCNST